MAILDEIKKHKLKKDYVTEYKISKNSNCVSLVVNCKKKNGDLISEKIVSEFSVKSIKDEYLSRNSTSGEFDAIVNDLNIL